MVMVRNVLFYASGVAAGVALVCFKYGAEGWLIYFAGWSAVALALSLSGGVKRLDRGEG
jgi:hypothetical protein